MSDTPPHITDLAPTGPVPMLDDDGPDVDDVEVDGSPLAEIEAELTAAVAGAPIRFDHPERPGWTVLYSRDISGPQIESYRKRSKAKGSKNVDAIKLAAMVLAEKCVGMERNGEEVLDDEGAPVTFRSRWLIDMYGAPGVLETVRRFYGLDGLVDSTANALVVEAGYGSEVDAVDPT